MSNYLIALAIAGAMSAPLAAQAQAQADAQAPAQASTEASQAQPAQPQMVKKCRRVPDYQTTGSMLGPTHLECRMVPAKGSKGSANAQQGGNDRDGGKK